MPFQILFSKNANEVYKTMDDEQQAGGVAGELPLPAMPPPPPPYEESSAMSSKPSTSSSSIGVRMGSVAGSSSSIPQQLSPASSTSQVADELNALQRAQLHLYKRLQQVKTQTYASLVVVLLLAGVILLFIANYHQTTANSHNHHVPGSELKSLVSKVASNDPESNKRIGKALSASLAQISSSLAQSNSMDENLMKHTIDKHLSQLLQDHQQNPSDSSVDQFKTAALESAVVNSISAVASSGSIQANSNDDEVLAEMKTKHQTATEPTTMMEIETTTTSSGSLTPELNPMATTIAHKGKTYNISIVVHSATVPNMDYLLVGRASDTFCEVFIDDILVGSTSVIDNSNNPNWQYLFPKPFTVRKDSTIRIDLQDQDHLKRDHIGGVLVVFGDLLNTERLNQPIKLFHGKGDIWVTIKLA